MILALQTAGAVTRLWLVESGKAPNADQPTLEWESGRDLADELLGKITTLLRQHGRGLADLTGIVVFSGPGSFTSLRIGHALANALADGLGIAVVGQAGDDWLPTGVAKLASTAAGHPALPFYGGDPNISAPKN